MVARLCLLWLVLMAAHARSETMRVLLKPLPSNANCSHAPAVINSVAIAQIQHPAGALFQEVHDLLRMHWEMEFVWLNATTPPPHYANYYIDLLEKATSTLLLFEHFLNVPCLHRAAANEDLFAVYDIAISVLSYSRFLAEVVKEMVYHTDVRFKCDCVHGIYDLYEKQYKTRFLQLPDGASRLHASDWCNPEICYRVEHEFSNSCDVAVLPFFTLFDVEAACSARSREPLAGITANEHDFCMLRYFKRWQYSYADRVCFACTDACVLRSEFFDAYTLFQGPAKRIIDSSVAVLQRTEHMLTSVVNQFEISLYVFKEENGFESFRSPYKHYHTYFEN
jgi:hypothetical protein